MEPVPNFGHPDGRKERWTAHAEESGMPERDINIKRPAKQKSDKLFGKYIRIELGSITSEQHTNRSDH
jgi:hypothetical protein